ncbi:hypothetical protein CKAN_00689900 [Cinnamomum micranthum f. kanehirae]|uniref:Uncharacterized protein n=1 Tax=Cinnamomum micranthum f. kanehirae TaxID=337451 RepID=A0A3S3N093_9MAGN|nr:hypothetical protein CKAN_00689900 [Cinnamomum micranthum f. kanehirae]
MPSAIARPGGGARWVCHRRSIFTLISFRYSQQKSPLCSWKISDLIVGKTGTTERWSHRYGDSKPRDIDMREKNCRGDEITEDDPSS